MGAGESRQGARPDQPHKNPDAEEEIAVAAFCAPRSGPNTGFRAKPHSIARIQPIVRPNPGSGRSPVLFKPVPSHREWRQGHSFQGSCGGMRRDHPSLIVESRSISAFYVRQVHASLLPMDRISAANHMAAS